MTKKKSTPVYAPETIIEEPPVKIASTLDELFCQRNPLWAGDHLGLPQASALSTIGDYGCGLGSIARKLTLLGFPTTPPDVQAALLRVDGFRHDQTLNLINWSRVPLAYPQFKYAGRGDYYTGKPTPASAMAMITDRLLRNDPVIIYVDASKYQKGLQQHFVLVQAVMKSGDLVIANPWNGKVQDLRDYDTTDALAVCGIILLDLKFDASKAI